MVLLLIEGIVSCWVYWIYHSIGDEKLSHFIGIPINQTLFHGMGGCEIEGIEGCLQVLVVCNMLYLPCSSRCVAIYPNP